MSFVKLNYKNQASVLVLNSPESFKPEIEGLHAICAVHTEWPHGAHPDFVLAFATRKAEVDAYAAAFAQNTEGDTMLWIAYPKGSSKKYKCDFNRGNGWEVMGEFGFEPVRQVALDEDWSVLRFRRVEFIKTMVRSFAMTEKGKEKAQTGTPKPPVEMPDDFIVAFGQSVMALAFFEKLAPSHRKEYIQWITGAKRAETRANRIIKAVEMLKNGVKRAM